MSRHGGGSCGSSSRPARPGCGLGSATSAGRQPPGSQAPWLVSPLKAGRARTRERPAVGDWVLAERHGDALQIVEVLPRSTAVTRRAPGRQVRQQVLAANVDVMFVVVAHRDVNARRIERYLAVAADSGA